MSDAVSTLLDRRREGAGRRALGRATGLALALHLLVATAALVLPSLLAKPVEPPRYVAVQIVPAARLGVENPRPAPRPPKPTRPEPVPETPKVSEQAPVLEDRKAKPAPQPPAPTPEPQSAPSPAAEPDTPPEVQGRQDGNASGLSLGAAVAGFDNPDFTYGYYVDQMLAKISDNWVRPPVGSGVEARLHFNIERDGRITDLRIAESSGINGFDLAALRAVQSASPLPPLPRAFREPTLGVNLIVR